MKPVLTSFGRLTGKTAIKFAEQNGLKLNAVKTGMTILNLSPDEARKCMAEGCEVWLDVAT